jgi:hypothetical protein
VAKESAGQRSADGKAACNLTWSGRVPTRAKRSRITARELWEQMNTWSCLNLILACILYWQGCEISRVLSECDPLANGIDLSLLEQVSPIEWDNVVLYGQYVLDRKLVRQRRRTKKLGLSVCHKINVSIFVRN